MARPFAPFGESPLSEGGRMSGLIRELLTVLTTNGISYLFRDMFTTDRAAGSVNGTAAEPSGETRAVTDTNSKLSITGGQVSFATGGVGAADPILSYPSLARTAGQIIIINIPSITSQGLVFGWAGSAGAIASNGFLFNNPNLQIRAASTNITVGAFSLGTAYQLLIITRTNGYWFFIRGGVFTVWTLAWVSNNAVIDPHYRSIEAVGTTSVFVADDIRIPQMTYIPSPQAYDTFTRSNGVLGSTEATGPDSQVITALVWAFTSGIWTIVTNKAVGTPSLGSDVIVNGAFAADTDWTKGSGWTISSGTANASAASANLTAAVNPLTVGRWYTFVYTVSAFSAGTVRVTPGGIAYPTHAANATYTETGRATDATFFFTGAGFTGSLDNVSAKLLTTAELFASVTVSTADVLAEVAIVLPSATGGVQAGLVLNLDSASNPQNFILCYLDGRGNCVLEECVAGIYTNKFTAAVTYSSGAVLRVIRSSTECRVFYNNTVVSTLQTMTANTNLNHGLFSTSALNTLDGFTVWARGAASEYASLEGL